MSNKEVKRGPGRPRGNVLTDHVSIRDMDLVREYDQIAIDLGLRNRAEALRMGLRLGLRKMKVIARALSDEVNQMDINDEIKVQGPDGSGSDSPVKLPEHKSIFSD